jgi:hypothetical protein
MIAVMMASGVASAQAFNGFDRNDYPGDTILGALHTSFSYTSYWLNAPPGERASSWTGKRAVVRERGFGFLLLWNGRLDKELKGKDAASMGRSDAAAAVAAAAREGFPKGALIFLDQEEGGRLHDREQASGTRDGAGPAGCCRVAVCALPAAPGVYRWLP